MGIINKNNIIIIIVKQGNQPVLSLEKNNLSRELNPLKRRIIIYVFDAEYLE